MQLRKMFRDARMRGMKLHSIIKKIMRHSKLRPGPIKDNKCLGVNSLCPIEVHKIRILTACGE